MTIPVLRKNQHDAIQTSIDNDFASGVHFHATGTGKSWIALEILRVHHQTYPRHHVLWLCEHQDILAQQFDPERLRASGFQDVLKRFHVFRLYKDKLDDWVPSVNAARFWGKPALVLINRPFLTSQDRYQKLSLSFSLIIHDECHTTINKSTTDFYDFVLAKNPGTRCIGFSATPLKFQKPFETVLTAYSIYDAFLDGVIVPPKITWIHTDVVLNAHKIARVVRRLVKPLVYKKILVWCGMIRFCVSLVEIWQRYFPGFSIGYDTSEGASGLDRFMDAEFNAILFCASKHREGSDIFNLDACVFLDGVSKRSAKTFVQCVGRVLRCDLEGKKTQGLIIDLKAKSPARVFERVHTYLQIDRSLFPWRYETSPLALGTLELQVHSLEMIKGAVPRPPQLGEEPQYTKDHLVARFVRALPQKKRYTERLDAEMNMMVEKSLVGYLLRAVEILDMTRGIPHVTRGSCGSSLVCYVLGISHVDPVRHQIKFARFLNEFRDQLPDIDFDFPYNKRDEVFLKLELRWPGRVARISNHVYYHEKSALRQAVRNAGIHKFIPKHTLQREIALLSSEKRAFIRQETARLEETFRGFSLHCGGIVFYPEGVPEDLVLETKTRGINQQIRHDKRNIAKEQRFKIDILSSRALAQLHEGVGYCEIPFEEWVEVPEALALLARGDNIGITFAESPLIRKTLMRIQPKNLLEMAICLAIIRPAAKDARVADTIGPDTLIFDDDAITIIAQCLGCGDGEADRFRRGLAKNCKKTREEFLARLDPHRHKEIMAVLKNLTHYSFCRSHAFSYAQLVYQIAILKVRDPQKFWTATLKHCESSYRKWVHIYEARRVGVHVQTEELSIFAQNRRKGVVNLSLEDQLRRFGFWDSDAFFPGCYLRESSDGDLEFNGIFASARTFRSKSSHTYIFFIGVAPGEYIEVEWLEKKNTNQDKPIISPSRYIGVEGKGVWIDPHLRRVRVTEYYVY